MNPIAPTSSLLVRAALVSVLTVGTMAGATSAAWAEPGATHRSAAPCSEWTESCTGQGGSEDWPWAIQKSTGPNTDWPWRAEHRPAGSDSDWPWRARASNTDWPW